MGKQIAKHSTPSPVAKGLTSLLCLLYILWPLDLIPDVIVVIGWIDDVVAFFIMVSAWLKR